MRKMHIVLALTGILATQPIFANDQTVNSTEGKPCATVANACLAAGYARTEAADKKFWQDCMKPILLDKKVQGINLDSAIIIACRSNKINELKKELNELQKVAMKKPS